MNAKAAVSVAVLAFVGGVVSGVAGSRSLLFTRLGEKASVEQQGAPTQPATIHGLLADLFKNSAGFILTGVEDNAGRCNIIVSITGLHDDYMGVSASKGLEFFVPYAAIHSIAREGPGPVNVPVVYTQAFPHPKFCGD